MSVVPATRVAMVWTPRGIVRQGVSPLRGEPDDAAELVDEAQYGELMTRLAERGEWTYVQGPDLYFGWMRAAHLKEYRTPQAVVVAVPLARAHAAPPLEKPGDQPVVGANVEARSDPQGECTPIRADARVDHRQVDGAGWKALAPRPEHEAGGGDVEGRDRVADVDEPSLRADGEDSRLHGRDVG